MKSKPTGKHSKSRAGTSLTEVMLALALFGSFAVGTCKMLVIHRRTLDMARDHYIAANLAKDRMELARTFEFDQIPDLQEDQILLDANGSPSLTGHFRRSTVITTLNTNLYQLAITVDIQNRKTLEFAPAEQTINTYIAKHL